MIIAINILYLVIILFFLLSALFISYHVIKYSLNRTEMMATLSIFLSVFVVLLISNLALFFSIHFDQILAAINS